MRRRRLRACLGFASLTALLTLLAVPVAGAPPATATPYLVADLDLQPGMGSYPLLLTTFEGRLLFFADDGVHGRQLWSSAGTPGSAMRLTGETIDPYLDTILLRVAGDRAFFSMQFDLWATDGTAAGTHRLLDPTGIDALAGFGVLGDRLFFGRGTGLWTSDGTVEGTVPVGAGSVSRAGDPIYPEPPAFGPAVAGRLFFRGGDDHSLWVTDGTAAGTVQIADLAWPERMTAAGARLFFVAGAGNGGLWVSDGTSEGTRMLSAFASEWGILGAAGDRLLYAIHGAGGWELRATDGNAGAGTLLAVMAEPPGWWTAPLGGGAALFAASDPAAGRELWTTDGTPGGTALLRDIFPGPAGSNPFNAVSAGDRVLFAANDGVSGAEPWISNGTAAGTHRVADVAPGPLGSMAGVVYPPSHPTFARLGDAVLLSADDGVLGRELWGVSLTGESGTCVPDAETLCFEDGRFAVRVSWFDQRSGTSGAGRAVPGAGRTGTFWFFRADNTELVVKLLDGRRVNGYFWFFYGALTDVEYDLTVTDTLGERERTYHNPPGWSCGEGDAAAFPAP